MDISRRILPRESFQDRQAPQWHPAKSPNHRPLCNWKDHRKRHFLKHHKFRFSIPISIDTPIYNSESSHVSDFSLWSPSILLLGLGLPLKKYPKLSRVYKSPFSSPDPLSLLSLQLSWQESTRKSRNSTAYLWSQRQVRQVLSPHCCRWLFSCFPQHLYNMYNINQYIYQYIFSFLGPLSQRDPTLPSKALLKPLTGIWNHSQCILGIKMWSAWKVTYLLYIFFIYLVVSSNQAKWHSGLPSASWYLPNPKFTGMVA